MPQHDYWHLLYLIDNAPNYKTKYHEHYHASHSITNHCSRSNQLSDTSKKNNLT